jgi:hypothetical protein
VERAKTPLDDARDRSRRSDSFGKRRGVELLVYIPRRGDVHVLVLLVLDRADVLGIRPERGLES